MQQYLKIYSQDELNEFFADAENANATMGTMKGWWKKVGPGDDMDTLSHLEQRYEGDTGYAQRIWYRKKGGSWEEDLGARTMSVAASTKR